MSHQLRKIIAFRFLKDNEIDYLSKVIEIIPVKSGDCIVEEFSKGTEIYFILEGSYNVIVNSNNQNSNFIAVIGEGDCFSESGLFPQMSRSASIIAANDGQVVRLNRNNLLKFISQFPAGGIKMLMMIIYSLLKKLRMLNRELAFERAEDSAQDEIDSLVKDFMNNI